MEWLKSTFPFLTKPEDLTRFENLTVEDLYHPRLITICHTFSSIITLANTLVCPGMIYVIATQSKKQMGNYKNLLGLQLSLSYMFNVITYLWHPIFFWPLTMGVSLSIFKLPQKVLYVILYAEMVILFMIVFIQAFLIGYRIFAMFQDSLIHLIYRNNKVFYFLLVLAVIASFCLASWIPSIKTLFGMYPQMIGFHPELSSGAINILITIVALAVFSVPFIFIVIAIILIIRLSAIKSFTSPQSFSMHKQLHKAMLVQLLIITTFLAIPGEAFLCLLYLEVTWGSIITPLCSTVIHLHLLLESLNLLYFIKPYRHYVLQKIKRIRNRVKRVGVMKKDNNFIGLWGH